MVLSQALGSDGTTRRRVIIMDEVDGMGGSDRFDCIAYSTPLKNYSLSLSVSLVLSEEVSRSLSK